MKVTLRLGCALAVLLVASAARAGDPYADDPPPVAPPREPPPAAPVPPTDVVSGAGSPKESRSESPPIRVESPPASSEPVLVKPPPPKPPEGPRREVHDSPQLARRLSWRWPKFQLYQYGLTLGQGALAVASVAIPGKPNFTGTNPFDEAGRNALRIPGYDGYLYARDASDVGLVLLLNQQLVDTLFVTWWFHDKGSTAFQMGLLDLQTVSFSAGLNSLVAGLVGRERPYARSVCAEGGRDADTSDCLGNNRYRSFFSGHSTAAFTLASLTCVHHINLPLYGGGVADAIPCATSMVTAAGVALLRVASDQHYLSDVMTGAAFGVASGFAIPYLFAYSQELSPSEGTKKALGVTSLSILPTPTGLQIGGTF